MDDVYCSINDVLNVYKWEISAKEIPNVTNPIALIKSHFQAYFTPSIVIEPFFFGKQFVTRSIVCSLTASTRYESMLYFVVHALQVRDILCGTFLMLDGASPHIGTCTKRLCRQYFMNDMVIDRYFSISCLPRSLDLNTCYIRLREYSKSSIIKTE